MEAPDREPLTGCELGEQIRKISTALGETPGLTAIVLPPGRELLLAILGAMLQGTAAPINPHYTINELRGEMLAVRPDAILTGAEEDAPAATVGRELGIPVVRAFCSAGTANEPLEQQAPAPRALPADTRLVLRTSSTTGTPKVVPLSASNLIASIDNQKRCFELRSEDQFLCLAPMWHLHGMASALAQLSAGGSVICTSGFDPLTFPNWLAALRPTWYTAPPTVHRAVASLFSSSASVGPHRLRFVRSSSAPLDADLQHRVEVLLGVPVVDSYGLTETGIVTAVPLKSEIRKPGSSGISAGPEITTLDGEIAVRGPNVISTYLDNEVASAESFRNGWFLTGDLGHIDDGHLFVTGRKKELINRGGEKIAPREVEAAFLRHPDVAEAAAFAVPHPSLHEDVAIAIVLQEGSQITTRQLRADVLQHLAASRVPRRIHFTDAIPRTSNGKPHRRQLASLYTEGRQEARLELSARERELAQIWSRVLACKDISQHDDLWDLGADSLSAAIMLAEVQAVFRITSPLSDFFDQPTIANLAGMIESAPLIGDRLIHLHGKGSRVPLISVPAISNDPYYLRHLAEGMHAERPFYVWTAPIAPERPVMDAAAIISAIIPTAIGAGPYILAGHCLGGVLAFETACQLSDAGADVQCVILFDTPAPGYPRANANVTRYTNGAWSLTRDSGLRALAAEIPRHLRFLYKSRKRMVTDSPAPTRTLRSYAPRSFYRPIIQVLSARATSTRVLEDERLGWRDFARGGFSTIEAAGDHNTILLPPAALELSQKLEALLAA